MNLRRMLAGLALSIVALSLPASAPASPTSERFYAKALVPFRAQRWEEAQQLLDRAVQSDPDDAIATYYRGLARARLGYKPAAIEDLRRALELRPDLPAAALDLGILYFEQEEYQQAELWLRRAYDEAAHRFSAALFLGLSLFRRGEYGQAEQYFAIAAKDPALRATARYYEGLTLLHRGEPEQARRALGEVSADRPGSELAQAAQEFLAAPSQAVAPRIKRWSVYGDLGFEYDSNVVLAPDDETIKDTRGISNESDGRVVIGAGAGVRALDTKHLSATLSYDFYQSVHFSLNEFDLQGHRFRLDLASKAGLFQFGASGYYDIYLLDFDGFYQQGVLTPWLTFFERDIAATQVYYRFRARDYLDDPYDPYRDGINNAFGVRQLFLLGAVDRYVSLGYQLDDENPISKDGDDFQYLGHQVDAHIRFPVASWFDTLAGYAFRFEDYDEHNSRSGTPAQFTERRQDDQHQLVLRLERPLLPYLSVAVEYLGVFNSSNIDEFEYDRHVGSIGVRVYF